MAMSTSENRDERNQILSKQSLTELRDYFRICIENQREELIQSAHHSDPEIDPLIQNLQTLSAEYLQGWTQIERIFLADFQNQWRTTIKKLVTKSWVNSIGVNFLRQHQLEKPIGSINFINSIEMDYWNQLKNAMFSSSRFKPVLQRIKKRWITQMDNQIEGEIKNFGLFVDPIVKKEYRSQYYKTPISFEEYLQQSAEMELKKTSSAPKTPVIALNPSNEKISGKEITPKTATSGIKSTPTSSEKAEELRKQYERMLEKKKIDQLKETQQQSFDNYQSYVEMDDREVARLRRGAPERRRVIEKKSRRDRFSKDEPEH